MSGCAFRTIFVRPLWSFNARVGLCSVSLPFPETRRQVMDAIGCFWILLGDVGNGPVCKGWLFLKTDREKGRWEGGRLVGLLGY